MRYSEFHQPSKARQDSGYTKLTSSSAELSSFMAQDKFVELLWENGQVLVHDQSGRNRRNIAVSTNFSDSDRVLRLHVDKATEKDNKDVGVPKTGRPEAMDSFLNEFCLADASYNAESNAKDGDNDMVPWMNYLMGDSIHREYYSGFLCDVPAASLHALSAHGTSVPIHTGSVVGECFSVEHENTYKICADASDPLRTKISHLNELPHQGQASVPAGIKPRAEDLHTGNDSNSQKGPTGSFEGTKLQKQDPPSPKPFQPSSVGLMNFSHFSRPAALAISNLKNVGKLRNNENTTIATCSQAPEPVVVQYSTRANLHSQSERQLNPVLTRLDHESSGKDSKDVTCYEHSKGNFQEHKTSNVTRRNSDTENCISIDHNSDRGSNFTPGLSLARSEIKKGREAIVMPASFCSRMSTGAVSNELKQRDKRKVQEAEESGSHSDDFEDELIGQTKSAAASKGPSIKRSRAAEVHNLSERRRRDRINEKMRALQELIPNCSKVDKASMLDEAIEYLKTLQLQVQMMSMGSGLFVPPLMLPGGMQQMGFGPMAHFSQIGLGMGMGMRLGYGMGMLDMNGSPNYSSLPLPPMHSPQFNCSAPCVPGVTGLHGVPASMAPVFRNPGDLPVSATPAPAAKPTTNPPPSVNSSGAKTNMVHAPDAMPSSSSADQKGQSAKREAVML